MNLAARRLEALRRRMDENPAGERHVDGAVRKRQSVARGVMDILFVQISGAHERTAGARIRLDSMKVRPRQARQRRHVEPDVGSDFENALGRRSGQGR